MTDGIRLIALLGSPRKNGNTEILTRRVLGAAERAGAQTELVRLRERRITPCLGCNACSKTGRCVLTDDMTPLYEKIEGADRLILASPIYFYSVSAWLKGTIDRFQPFWARKHILKDPPGQNRERWGAFISVGGANGKRLFEGAVMTARYSMKDANIKYSGHLLIPGVDGPGDILKHPEYLSKADEFGAAFITDPARGVKYAGVDS